MKGYEEWRRGFEAEFTRNQELAFRTTVRGNKLFGLWVAERLGLPRGEAEAYAKSVINADFDALGDNDVIAKVQADLAAKGISLDEAELRAELARAVTEARRPLAEA
jgi:hypothetical protein